ncbi:MAG: biotin/lipoyl-containing protein [Acidobacteriaceae bacterium]
MAMEAMKMRNEMKAPRAGTATRIAVEADAMAQAGLSELASRFGVSRGWAWKISAARKRSGQVERQPYRPGARSRLNSEALARLLTDHPDWTLRQLQAGLKKQTGVGFSAPYVWLRLKRMNFRLKKSHSTPKSATAKPTKSGASSSSRKSVRPRRNV